MSAKRWSFYSLTDGRFLSRKITCSKKVVAMNTPEGYEAIEGHFDHKAQRVDLTTRAVVDDQELAAASAAADAAARRHERAIVRLQANDLKKIRALSELVLDQKNESAIERLRAIEAENVEIRRDLNRSIETETSEDARSVR